MRQEQMFDSYQVNTTDINVVSEVLDDFSKSLEVISMYTRDIRLVSYICEEPNGDFIVACSTPPDHKDASYGKKVGVPKFVRIARNSLTMGGKLSETFINEFKKNGYFLTINKNAYMCSSNTLGTLCTRCSIGGDGILTGTSVLRDSLIGELLYERSSKCTLVIRKSDDGVKKVFSVLGSAYAPIEQNVIKDIIQKCEEDLEMKSKLVSFTANNFITRAYIEFPEKNEEFKKTYGVKGTVVPGVCISTSDVGESSLVIWGTMRINDTRSPAFFGEVARKHSGKIDLDNVKERIHQNIFSEYSAIPKRLVELDGINVSDPKYVLEEACKKAGFNKLLGKNYTKDVIELLSDEFIDGVPYTAYDVATKLLSAPDRIKGLSDNVLLLFKKNIKEALFVKYEEIAPKTSLKSGLYVVA